MPLSRICDAGTYDIHPFLKDFPGDNNLYQSIQLTGIISPPVVQESEANRYDIICGRQRLRCLEFLGVRHCHCQILPRAEKSENILAIILEDQFACSPLNLIEQACFIELCQNHLLEKQRFHSFLQNMLPGRITKGIRFLQPLAKLESNLKYRVHTGSISEKILAEMLNFSKEDRNQFILLIDRLQLGVNNQKKLIQQLDDIIKRENISLAQLINQQPIAKILKDNHLSKTKRTSDFLASIQRLHKPRLSDAQDDFTQRIKSLKLPETCNLSPSQSFETSAVTLSVEFNTYERFAEKWDSLRKILDKE